MEPRSGGGVTESPPATGAGEPQQERDHESRPQGDNWHPGDAPSQVLRWSVSALAKAGTLGIVGVYPATAQNFPIGEAMNKNLAVNMGNCHHRRYIPRLVRLTQTGVFDPAALLTREEPMADAIAAYRAFDRRAQGWLKVALRP